MHENQKKEQFSLKMISAVAHNCGLKTDGIAVDDGIDFIIGRSIKRVENGVEEWEDDIDIINVQLKSTTIKYARIVGNNLHYRLKVSNYNKLVRSRQKRKYNPYILILFVFPEDENNWMHIDEEYMLIQKYAFWYYPEKDQEEEKSKEKSDKILIKIPLKNKIEVETLKKLYNGFKKGIDLQNL